MKKSLSLPGAMVAGAVLDAPVAAEDAASGLEDGCHQGPVSRAELESHSEVREAIRDIRQETGEAVADLDPDAPDREDRKTLLQIEKDRLLTEAILDEGSTVQRFKEIETHLENDPALQRRLREST